MNFIISIIIGAMTSIMILFNGTLSNAFGNYISSIIIHIVGLLLLIPVLLISKTKIKLSKEIPVYLYCAGAVGVFTVLFTNISYLKLGASLTIALGLLGQSLISIIIDHMGLLGMKAIKFNKKKFVGLSLIVFGIFVMTIF
jgi:transporter family-2 protein